jgi:hypothetical protein
MQQTPNLGLNKPDGTDVVDIADLNANMDIIDGKLGATGHNHNGTVGNGPKITNAGLAAGAADDAAIGSRTVNQALASPANAGTITQLLSWLAGRIKAITGATNWYDAPAITLAAINTFWYVRSQPQWHNRTRTKDCLYQYQRCAEQHDADCPCFNCDNLRCVNCR